MPNNIATSVLNCQGMNMRTGRAKSILMNQFARSLVMSCWVMQ